MNWHIINIGKQWETAGDGGRRRQTGGRVRGRWETVGDGGRRWEVVGVGYLVFEHETETTGGTGRYQETSAVDASREQPDNTPQPLT